MTVDRSIVTDPNYLQRLRKLNGRHDVNPLRSLPFDPFIISTANCRQRLGYPSALPSLKALRRVLYIRLWHHRKKFLKCRDIQTKRPLVNRQEVRHSHPNDNRASRQSRRFRHRRPPHHPQLAGRLLIHLPLWQTRVLHTRHKPAPLFHIRIPRYKLWIMQSLNLHIPRPTYCHQILMQRMELPLPIFLNLSKLLKIDRCPIRTAGHILRSCHLTNYFWLNMRLYWSSQNPLWATRL
jgi:hypothetical protein